MVKFGSAIGATALLLASSVVARTPVYSQGDAGLWEAVAHDPTGELQRIVQADLTEEAELKKKPKQQQKLSTDRETGDEILKEQAQSIKKFKSITVIGDSYASGDGAYKNAGNGTCRRNEGSFGYRLNKILEPESHQFVACSGAPVKDIKDKQVEGLKYGEPDLIVFTAGGDNGGSFVKVLLSCILNPSEKKCDKALAFADKTADELPDSLEPLYKSILAKPTNPARKREVIHLGYIQMYNRDGPVDQCPAHGSKQGSDVTWPSTGADGYRQKINNVIVKINSKIKEAADKNGVTYIDADAHFAGHRFCDGPDASWMQHRLSFSSEGGIICHPTWEGHSAYIKAILGYLKNQKA